MKKVNLILLGILISAMSFSQTWLKSRVLGTSATDAKQIYFISQDTGWCVSSGTMTTDGGKTWTSTGLFGSEINFRDKNNGFIIGNAYIHITTDRGLTWKNLSIDINQIAYLDASNLIVVDKNNRLKKTTDLSNASSWNYLTNDISVTSAFFTSAQNGFYINQIFINKVNITKCPCDLGTPPTCTNGSPTNITLYSYNLLLYKTNNGGQSFDLNTSIFRNQYSAWTKFLNTTLSNINILIQNFEAQPFCSNIGSCPCDKYDLLYSSVDGGTTWNSDYKGNNYKRCSIGDTLIWESSYFTCPQIYYSGSMCPDNRVNLIFPDICSPAHLKNCYTVQTQALAPTQYGGYGFNIMKYPAAMFGSSYGLYGWNKDSIYYYNLFSYKQIEFYSNVTSNTDNPNNYVTPGQKVRFKIAIKNEDTNDYLTLSGTLKSLSPYATVTDGSGTYNNVLKGQTAYNSDEFEVQLSSSISADTEIDLDLVLSDQINKLYPNTIRVKIPIILNPFQVTAVNIDDDNIPDSKGNNNKTIEPDETIELIPSVKKTASYDLTGIKGTLSSTVSTTTVWNNKSGASGTVYNTFNYNLVGSVYQPANDYVFDNKTAANTTINFDLLFQANFKYMSTTSWQYNGTTGILLKWAPANFSMLNGTAQIPSLVLTAPLSGSYIYGQSCNITWTQSQLTNIKLEYSIDNGTTWSSIIASTPASGGSYNWTIPNLGCAASNICIIRASDLSSYNLKSTTNITVTKQNSFFTLNFGTLTSGSSLIGGNVGSITWTTNASTLGIPVDFNLKVEYSSDNKTTWQSITNSTLASNKIYSWTLPVQTCKPNTYYIKLSSTTEQCIYSESGGYSINPIVTDNTTLQITQPTGATAYKPQDVLSITWTQTNVSNVNIEYSSDNGTTWNSIVSNTSASTGKYDWTIPATFTPSSNCKIRITNPTNTCTQAAISNIFAINAIVKTLSLSYPVGGEQFKIGDAVVIRWNQQNVTTVKLEYSSDNGTTWKLISDNITASAGLYSWTIPALKTNTFSCLVRISDSTNPTLTSKSNSSFTVTQTSGISETEINNAKLFQNEPNPFANSTIIKYYLPENTKNAVLTITTASGINIKTINLICCGLNQLQINSNELKAGIYFYSLVIDGKLIETKQMVITE